MESFDVSSGWPTGVSDGLSLACEICQCHTNYDYSVTDEFWEAVVPEDIKRGVVCLDCLDKISKREGYWLFNHLIQIQYTGINETILLRPQVVFTHDKHL